MSVAAYHMRMNKDRVVYVVDDDVNLVEQLCMVFRLEGFITRPYFDFDVFLEACNAQPPDVAVISDAIGSRGGLEVLQDLDVHHPSMLTVLTLREADVSTAVMAMRAGALDVVTMPIDAERLVRTVIGAIHRDSFISSTSADGRTLAIKGFRSLTPREREVLQLITQGASNKVTANELGISHRTVEVHRARCMVKLGARNTAELVRIVLGR